MTLWLVNGLATLKTYFLFSFMFGVGLGFLMRSANRRGLALGRIYRNRILGLLILGIAHGCLFFTGDILVIYAVTGAILYRVRSWPAGRLVGVGTALLPVQVVIAPPLLLSVPDAPADMIAREREIMTRGSVPEVVLFRAIGFAFALPVFLVVRGTAALGWFCPGLWGAVDRTTATGIALAVTLALIGLVAVWRMRFALGPFEWVLRRITHAGQAGA